jgi:hypothetical protein
MTEPSYISDQRHALAAARARHREDVTIVHTADAAAIAIAEHQSRHRLAGVAERPVGPDQVGRVEPGRIDDTAILARDAAHEVVGQSLLEIDHGCSLSLHRTRYDQREWRFLRCAEHVIIAKPCKFAVDLPPHECNAARFRHADRVMHRSHAGVTSGRCDLPELPHIAGADWPC